MRPLKGLRAGWSNYEHRWLGSAKSGKLLVELSSEMADFLAHISALQKP